MSLLIRGARIVDYSSDFLGDVYVNNGIIETIGTNSNIIGGADEVIEAQGYVLMPAFVDLHVHFRDPGLTYKEDIETGSKAAAAGGYTTVNLMANTKPVCSSMDTVNYVLNKAKEVGLIEVHQCVSITNEFSGDDLSHLDNIDTSIVRFLSDDGKGVKSDKVMYDALNKAKKMNVTIISHAEDPEFSSSDMRLAENMMTFRDVALAESIGARLHMAHVSTKEAMECIVRAKQKGAKVTCEVMPHHLALDSETKYRVNPPTREKEDVAALIEAIKKGYVDAIATDHAPHSEEDKKKGAPGISGIETSFGICYSTLVDKSIISLSKLSELMSKGPADIMKLKKGRIEPGYQGDLVLVNLDDEYKVDVNEFKSKGKNSPFNGWTLKGRVDYTIKLGKIVYRR
ncbi:dihydroorotase [Clostridium oryzae]|uniref:Dihydroorotase n=1 Tax=Clostridium oryzae TaxID=1450648 RepID=A0A1V4IJW1_9CLOT|nr:dihydroorotase [Clostridium oryzae]OPJ60308.1 dihydroorotase [Clostridium oryzae]